MCPLARAQFQRYAKRVIVTPVVYALNSKEWHDRVSFSYAYDVKQVHSTTRTERISHRPSLVTAQALISSKSLVFVHPQYSTNYLHTFLAVCSYTYPYSHTTTLYFFVFHWDPCLS